MSPTFEDFIQSRQFTFFVGQEGKSIVVHAAAIAATSDQLDALINGGMQESATQCATIEDVTVEDFVRFCEYAYRGDYTTPLWEEELLERKSTSSIGQQNGDIDSGDVPLSKAQQKRRKQQQQQDLSGWGMPAEEVCPTADEESVREACEADTILRSLLRSRFYSQNFLGDGGLKAQILQQFEPKSNSADNQNFTPVLLAHARIYCFAHLRMIEPLKALALHKLQKTLKDFKFFTKRVGDIIELARFAYSNPDLPGRGDDGTIDVLRRLVVEYIVLEIDTIGSCEEFVKYMEDGGEFVGDFWKTVREYVV